MNLGHNCIGMSRLWSLLLPTSVYNIFVRIYWTLEKLCNFPNFGVAAYKAYLRDLQHKISKCLRWRTCCSDEFGAQLYWHESSMKLTTAYKCLQHICKDLLNFGKIMQFSKFWGGWVYSLGISLRDLQHKISKCLRWRTCCSDEFGAQLYWQESSMKYFSHIGAVVVENVRIYHDLGYILVICEYLQHKILECLRRRAKPTDAFAAAYYFLQVSTTYL